jgi:uncharacterized membrane protein
MMFLALLLAASGAAALAGRLGVPGLRSPTASMRLGMALALWFAGTDHLLTTERYLPMMPPALPAPVALVLFTGLCEIAGGLGLLLPQTRKLAGIMLAMYFVGVFPANVLNAVAGLNVDGVPSATWYLWARLLLQPLFVWWALKASDVIGGGDRKRLRLRKA